MKLFISRVAQFNNKVQSVRIVSQNMSAESENFNTDELEAPEWMNTDFFTTVLKHCTGRDDIGVKSFKMSPATAKGDHYASIMFRGLVVYVAGQKEESKSLIIKTMPEVDGHKKEMLGDTYLFETEIGIYTEILPKVEDMLRKAGDNTVIGPPCLYYSLSPRKIVIFEDLVPLGYTVIRSRDVNFNEAKEACMKLAKLQAVSLKLLQEDPKSFNSYRHHMMVMPSIEKSGFMTDGINNFIEMLQNESSLREYLPYFEPLKENLISNSKKYFVEYWSDPQPKTFYVLSHGDFHSKNMMFKLSPNGDYEDVLLLDFQICHMGSFATDLIYSMFVLADKETRRDQVEQLFESYVDTFNKTADAIGYTGRKPTLKDVLAEIKAKRYWLIFVFTSLFPVWAGFKDASVDPQEVMESNDTRRSLYKRRQLVEELQYLLPKYKALGYFDDL